MNLNSDNDLEAANNDAFPNKRFTVQQRSSAVPSGTKLITTWTKFFWLLTHEPFSSMKCCV